MPFPHFPVPRFMFYRADFERVSLWGDPEIFREIDDVFIIIYNPYAYDLIDEYLHGLL